MALEGNLEDMSLPNIMQVICLERRSIRLTLKRGAEQGMILFENGDVVHSEIGKLAGEESVYYLLSWTEGSFRTASETFVKQRTIAARWDQILMEGMKRLDELERDLAANARVMPNELTADELEHDAHLENEMLALMSRLDCLRARLAERNTQKKPAQALHILSGIANQVVEFSEAMLGSERSQAAMQQGLEHAQREHYASQVMQLATNRLPADKVSDLYTQARSHAQRQQVFTDASHSIIDVIDASFAQLIKCFRSTSTLGEIKEACDFFLVDLNHVVGEVRA